MSSDNKGIPSLRRESGARAIKVDLPMGRMSSRVPDRQPGSLPLPSEREQSTAQQVSSSELEAAEAALSTLRISRDSAHTISQRPEPYNGYGNDVRTRVYNLLRLQVPTPDIRQSTGVGAGTIQKWKNEWRADPEIDSSTFSTAGSKAGVTNDTHDAETRNRVLARIRRREPLQVISDDEDISLTTLRTWRNQAGIPPAVPSKGMKWSPATRSKVQELLDKKVPLQKVNELTGVPIPTIHTWRQEPDSQRRTA